MPDPAPEFVFEPPSGATRFRLRLALGRQALLGEDLWRGELETRPDDRLAIVFEGRRIGERDTVFDWSTARAVRTGLMAPSSATRSRTGVRWRRRSRP